MKYLLDTNTCIAFLKQRKSVVDRIELCSSPPVLCSIVKAELLYGCYKSNQRERNLALLIDFFSTLPSLPFDDRAAEYYGQLRAFLAHRGTPIGANDLLIAAIGLANELVLVTHNVGEFSRVPGLRLEDWE
ncbi:MAG: type II toxin-antitoxin system VapC family toxin [Magnetococcales bacterium]|nr:type II toxin-antitoxin system VapC family toxin [Magnetococcales bacterium]